ncbi:MAG: hypothetical protein ACO4AA_02140 [Aquiluna sp.]
MDNTSIFNSVTTLKGFVSDLKETIFRRKTGSFVFLARCIQRQLSMIENRCKICSAYIGKNDLAEHSIHVITREIADIRKVLFEINIVSVHNDSFLEIEDEIYDSFDQIELHIEYLEAMFSNKEVSQ